MNKIKLPVKIKHTKKDKTLNIDLTGVMLAAILYELLIDFQMIKLM